MDCCVNEYQAGTCCCSFRRAGKFCQIHPVSSDPRIHCHSYYQKRSQEEEGTPIITLDVHKLHVPLNDENNCYLFSKRSFSAESCERVKQFFYSIVQNPIQSIINANTFEIPRIQSTDSDNAFRILSSTPNVTTSEIHISNDFPVVEDLKKISKKRYSIIVIFKKIMQKS